MPKEPDTEELLKQQADALQALIDEAQRLQREIHDHLSKLRHAGEPSSDDKRR